MQFNEQQLKIINTPGGRIAVIAGAGSGKTTTTIKLIEKLHLKDGIALEKMFISTFTNKAGKDIKTRLQKRFNLDTEHINKLWVGTFHSLGHRYLTQIKKLNLNIILPVEGSYYLKNIYKAVLQTEGEDENVVTFKDISENIEMKRNQNCSWDKASEYPDICRKVHDQYQKEKKEQDLVDFTDILEIFVSQLKKDVIFTNKFSWVFVDEVQDNNFSQNVLTDLLTTESVVRVGDLKQCWHKDESIPVQLDDGHIVNKKAIDVLVGDRVKSLEGHNVTCFHCVSRKEIFDVSGFVKITTISGRTLHVSKDHLVYNDVQRKLKPFVYLMYDRFYGYRIGTSIGVLGQRARAEHSNRLWLLKECETKEESLMYEKIYSLEYQIPEIVFNWRPGCLLDETRKVIFDKFGKNKNNLNRIFKDFNLDYAFPHYMSLQSNSLSYRHELIRIKLIRLSEKRKVGRNRKFEVEIGCRANDVLKQILVNEGYLLRKYFSKYEEAFKWSSGIEKTLGENGYSHVFVESIYLDRKNFILKKAKSLLRGSLILVNGENQTFYEEIKEIQFIDEDTQIVSLDVPHTGIITNESGIVSHNSIYKWRGATPQLFKDNIKIANHTYYLSYNYRSTQQIIGFANAMLKQIPAFHGQELKHLPINGFKPTFIICDDIALRIYKAIRHDISTGIPFGEIAVLGRSVKPVSIQRLQVLLRRDRIPYTVRGGSDKLNAPFIQNFLSVLKSLANPTKVSLVNALSILPSVGPKTAFKLAESVVASGMSFAPLKTASGRFAQTKAFQGYLNLKYLHDNDTMKELLLRSFDFYHDHYLVPYYGKKDPTEPSNKKTIIFEVLFNYLMGYKNLADGIDSLYVNEDDADDGENKIVISTVHQCVTRETLLETDKGLQEISDIPETGNIGTPSGPKMYKGKFTKSGGDIFKIQTKKGYTLNASPEHGVSVWDGISFARKRADELKIKDIIRLKLGETIPIQDYFSLHKETPKDVREVVYKLPTKLGEDIGELLGLIVGDGTIYYRGLRISKDQIEVIDRADEILRDIFGCSVKRGFLNEKTPYLEVNSTFLSRWFLGFDGLSPNKKNVPKAILQSPLSVQKKFIKGLFEDGTVGMRNGDAFIDFRNYKSEIIKKVQIMLLRMGIVSTIRVDKKYYDHKISILYIFGYFARVFKNDVGLISKCKLANLEKGNFGKEDQYIVPFSRKESEIFKGKFETISDWQNVQYRGYLGRDKVKKLYTVTEHPLLLEKLSWHYERITSLSKDFEETFCVEVPEGNRFLQNGIDGWNSKGLEWDSVHIANMNEYAIPFIHEDYEGDDGKLEEEFCLAYVATTRAKKNLRMYMQFMNGTYNGARANKISRFIKELVRTTGEQYMSLRVMDVPNEANYKRSLLMKIRE